MGVMVGVGVSVGEGDRVAVDVLDGTGVGVREGGGLTVAARGVCVWVRVGGWVRSGGGETVGEAGMGVRLRAGRPQASWINPKKQMNKETSFLAVMIVSTSYTASFGSWRG